MRQFRCNIDSIITLFGGDFNKKTKLYVIDNTNVDINFISTLVYYYNNGSNPCWRQAPLNKTTCIGCFINYNLFCPIFLYLLISIY